MIVYADSGCAIDWNWSTGLTVWSAGADRVDRVIGSHQLDHTPSSERKATNAAERWWLREGRAEQGHHGGQSRPTTEEAR